MIKVGACHVRDARSNPIEPSLSHWNYFTGGSSNLGMPEVAGWEQERAILHCMSVGVGERVF